MAGDQTLIDAVEAADEPERAGDAEQRVGPLELFFDLVFVFAITQVTQFIANDPTWEGLARALLILAVVWWAWAAYAWLTNTLLAPSVVIATARTAGGAERVTDRLRSDPLRRGAPTRANRGARRVGSPADRR